ncbi:DNA (cytosine-5)-methyltransferase CMT3 [Camellia lanceoleosa]|uniref:DNA (Cytosine-5)-methyltransferase CMT3 n=1 Tax=Camellia lanceoleosa TaxID=1840588 RepID=A0ACC0GE70_9ERIC|nr:DNA (cytosine-5)-methyltransferase CMT3 [Camellia lanceoleosa]
MFLLFSAIHTSTNPTPPFKTTTTKNVSWRGGAALFPHREVGGELNKAKSKHEEGATLNELVELKGCSSCLFFERRKHKDLYLWMAKCPNGPSVKFLVNAVLILALGTVGNIVTSDDAQTQIIKSSSNLIDNKRVFFSEVKDDNPLNCLVERLRIVRLPLNVDLSVKDAAILNCDYYRDMMYLLPYSSFFSLPLDNMGAGSESDSTISSETDLAGPVGIKFDTEEVSLVEEHKKEEMTLLDLYSGCGAMSTGLCLGSNMSGVNLVTNPDPAIAEAPKESKIVRSSRNKRIGDF